MSICGEMVYFTQLYPSEFLGIDNTSFTLSISTRCFFVPFRGWTSFSECNACEANVDKTCIYHLSMQKRGSPSDEHFQVYLLQRSTETAETAGGGQSQPPPTFTLFSGAVYLPMLFFPVGHTLDHEICEKLMANRKKNRSHMFCLGGSF